MLARQLAVPGRQLSLCRLLYQAFQLNKAQTAPGVILIFCSSPDSSKSISEQKSYPWKNPHYYIAILSSVEFLWGAIPLPASPLAMNVFAASSMNKPTPGGGLHVAISSVKSLWPSLWSLHASVSSVRPPYCHLLSEVSMHPSPQWGPYAAFSAVRLTQGHLPSKARMPLQHHVPRRAQLGTACRGTAQGRAEQPSGKIYSQIQICKHAHFMDLFETLLKASHMELRRTWQQQVM